jgi:hypothetical protein
MSRWLAIYLANFSALREKSLSVENSDWSEVRKILSIVVWIYYAGF